MPNDSAGKPRESPGCAIGTAFFAIIGAAIPSAGALAFKGPTPIAVIVTTVFTALLLLGLRNRYAPTPGEEPGSTILELLAITGCVLLVVAGLTIPLIVAWVWFFTRI